MARPPNYKQNKKRREEEQKRRNADEQRRLIERRNPKPAPAGTDPVPPASETEDPSQ